jgi:hypothetical protein
LNSESFPRNQLAVKSSSKSLQFFNDIKRIPNDKTNTTYSCFFQNSRQSQGYLCELQQHNEADNLGNQSIFKKESGKQRILQTIEWEELLGEEFESLADDDSSLESTELDAYMDDSIYDHDHDDSSFV